MINNYLITIELFSIPIFPFLGSIISGVLGKFISIKNTHRFTIFLMFLSTVFSFHIFWLFIYNKYPVYNELIYNWISIGNIQFTIGLLIDQLTVLMLVIITFISLLVHIYSIGYMQKDIGYKRFFSYISGFTFSMMLLVMSNGFLLLFFGWEGVGLFSYLLIGFWFRKESANIASLKAILINRIADIGFILGISIVFMHFHTLDYQLIFHKLNSFIQSTHKIHIIGSINFNIITLICILFFIAAIGKSAQIPLHIWLEGSMEGPTPVSALIHSATMVTAGIFIIARLSPIFENSSFALSSILIIGSITSLFMGILAIVQKNIKNIIAYSTISQLGYMMIAQGISAFPIGMFHLLNHAVFKSLLFLSAGSIIHFMESEKNIQYMGNLYKNIPTTYICMLIGCLSLVSIPPFSGFFSKELIINSIENSKIYGHNFAYFCAILGTFFTSIYAFRMFFVVFHGKKKWKKKLFLKKTPLSILIPLIILSILSIFLGLFFFKPILLGNLLGNSIFIKPEYNVLKYIKISCSSINKYIFYNIFNWSFLLSIFGIFISWICYIAYPKTPYIISKYFSFIYKILIKKYYFNQFYEVYICTLIKNISQIFRIKIDLWIIHILILQGLKTMINNIGLFILKVQNFFLCYYAFSIIFGLMLFCILIFTTF